MKRHWFQDRDGTYYRNCPMILDDMKATPWFFFRQRRRLELEWRNVWLHGGIRKSQLGRGDVVVRPASMRDAYPDRPGFWTLDEHWLTDPHRVSDV